jgi:predicted dehydrogenase
MTGQAMTGQSMPREPLRIGILGAARIAGEGIVEPAHRLGHRLVAVAARDPRRAASFAEEHGVERAVGSYADLVADDEVEVVYNALVNVWHAPWTIAALRAGKHVLSEKPMTSNAAEAHEVHGAAEASDGTVVEGFHYLHHPVNQRLRDLVVSGVLGEIRTVDVLLQIPAPPDNDPRWSYELAGGATMDLGCYVINALRHLGRWMGTEIELRAAEGIRRRHAPEVDEAMRIDVLYGNGATGVGRWDMAGDDLDMAWTIEGTRAAAISPAFAIPHRDNRLHVRVGKRTTTEAAGDQTSYTYQLAALASTLREGAAFPVDLDDAVANAEFIDAAYALSGFPRRPSLSPPSGAGSRPGRTATRHRPNGRTP